MLRRGATNSSFIVWFDPTEICFIGIPKFHVDYNDEINKNERMSEWLFISNTAVVQLYHGENKLIFNEMMMMSALF